MRYSDLRIEDQNSNRQEFEVGSNCSHKVMELKALIESRSRMSHTEDKHPSRKWRKDEAENERSLVQKQNFTPNSKIQTFHSMNLT